jgi:hypothetical protein
VPVIYTGPGATEANINAFEADIRSAWAGQIGDYTVNVNFLRGGYAPNGNFLFGDFVYMADAGQSRSWYYSGNGMMAINTNEMLDAARHEFGHLLGNTLHYDTPHEGYDNNVMVVRGGAVEQINIDDAIARWGGWRSNGFKPPGS